jgi:hypothetical protein
VLRTEIKQKAVPQTLLLFYKNQSFVYTIATGFSLKQPLGEIMS